MQASDFFNLPKSLPFQDIFDSNCPPWEWLPKIGQALESLDFNQRPAVKASAQLWIGERVWIDPTVKLPPYGCIEGPAYIGAHTELRPGVYIRSNVIIGEHCVLGNSCEYKNALLMDCVQTAHFHYVGDSILGSYAHLGAGVILSNVRLDRRLIDVQQVDQKRVTSGLKKLGAIIGEKAEIGCNAVLLPGTLVGREAKIHPCIAVGGHIPAKSVVKLEHRPRVIFI